MVKRRNWVTDEDLINGGEEKRRKRRTKGG